MACPPNEDFGYALDSPRTLERSTSRCNAVTALQFKYVANRPFPFPLARADVLSRRPLDCFDITARFSNSRTSVSRIKSVRST
jgi:hypothetical protein